MDVPAMPFWVQRFLGSARVLALPGPDRWWYGGLLLFEWSFQGSGLPKDLETLARLLGVDWEELERAWWGRGGQPGISQFFKEHNGRLFNDTCEEEFRKAKRAKLAASRVGSRNAKKRWDKERADARGIATAMHRADGDGDGDGSSEKKGREGEHGEEETLRFRLEGQYEEGVPELLKEIGRFARCNPETARKHYLRLREPKRETFEAWGKFAAVEGTPAALGAMHNFGHPDEVTEQPQGKTRKEREAELDSSRAASAEARLEAVERKRAAERRAAEAFAKAEAVPAPKELIRAISTGRRGAWKEATNGTAKEA